MRWGEAELMVAPRPAGLAAEPVRQPHVGPPLAQEFLDDRLGAVGVGDEGGAVAVVEDPQPPVGLPHAHARLIARQRRAGEQPLLDQVRLGREGRARRAEDVDERALADVEAEQVFQDVGQPSHRDALD